jgi:hypothetical protein
MIVNHVDQCLPAYGTFVLCHYTGGNWSDNDDQEGCEWVVAQLRRCVVQGNNLRPYYWSQFGPGTLFGQDVDLWCELPRKGQDY